MNRGSEEIMERKAIFYEGSLCPVCETGTLVLTRKETEFEYKHEKLLVTRDVLECQTCQETFFQPHDEREIEKLLTDRRRTVDGLLTSDEIRTIRQQFGLTQVEFATYLRVSQKTFARYETGQATQSYAMDDLLRILQNYPEVIKLFTQKTSVPQPMQPRLDALVHG